MELADTTYSNPVFAFHNIYNHIQDGVSDEEYIKQPDHTLPLEESLMFRGNCWYDWNVRNWGTKWDVAVHDNDKYPDTELHEESTTVLGYKFNTAWSPPIEAITKLSEQYPSLEMNLIATEEESYENKCRDCDEVNTLEYCEEGCGEICDSCHYMGEADLDCVAECDTHKVYLDNVPDYRKVEA
ncbi:MAG: hypothetical protein EBY03_05945 [Actinobacteria bacterium]|nr:hypothetical protein [Actinomycetota bacterium]